MATAATRLRGWTSVSYHPVSEAANLYRRARGEAIEPGFAASPKLDLKNFGGHTIPALTFTNVYLGKWTASDRKNIDHALSAAMADRNLNNMIAQYFPGKTVSATFVPSRTLPGPVPARVFKDTVEGFVAAMDSDGSLASFALTSSVINFVLPKGVVLVDGTSSGHQEESKLRIGDPEDEQVDSKHGLGGYHGSVHVRRGTKKDTVYYAVSVYSQGSNGIDGFGVPWKNIVATFYHELQEARTDPDVEDASKTGKSSLLGWYSPKGGEIGDIPMDEAGPDLSTVMKEVPLADGSGTVPIQLMWSNAVHGPEGPIPAPH
jgi:hypothetical protein